MLGKDLKIVGKHLKGNLLFGKFMKLHWQNFQFLDIFHCCKSPIVKNILGIWSPDKARSSKSGEI